MRIVFQDCLACGGLMKLAHIEAFAELAKVDVHTFFCTCGSRREHLVARKLMPEERTPSDG